MKVVHIKCLKLFEIPVRNYQERDDLFVRRTLSRTYRAESKVHTEWSLPVVLKYSLRCTKLTGLASVKCTLRSRTLYNLMLINTNCRIGGQLR